MGKWWDEVPNRFEVYEVVDDKFAENLGKVFTLIFAFVTIGLTIFVSVEYSRANVTQVVYVPESGDGITYQQYLDIVDQEPTCPCNMISIPYKTFATFEYDLDTFCDAMVRRSLVDRGC
jgi:hypothetical protein